MKKKGVFGNVEFSRKVKKLCKAKGIKFGKPVKFRLLFAKEVTKFIKKLEEATRRAGKSKLKFGAAA